MRKIILLFAVLLLSTPSFAMQNPDNAFGLSNGETVKQYDKHGSYQGYYRQSGSQTKEYNKNGSYQGYYCQSGNTAKHYDKYGSYQGYYRK